MDSSKEMPVPAIFPKGEKISGGGIVNDHFTGTAWLSMLVPDDGTYHCPIYNVTFEPGARNNWHKHPGGQILLVTGGRGYYQEEGKPARELHAGDVVTIPPQVKHWHGAAPDSGFVHIGITANPGLGDARWLEPVTDEEYQKLD
ncbi:Cupin 2, conserved barrel domain protein [Methanoregula boonei 6A8]|jgi:quercetin dioxygenase-like cupin family protein|uniref:Cupin 2, conserved barrel domain protein n=1 Tax=Methanoregula boonei (strain DSM 21154 / JCM 14090 / 6A8) TaxID=456442 RepID=A7I6V6_METB6|nr:cupin domain-containing protein [Methanoregula boonei]ABS55467.1 Cupin 2, conserved barrel domain protein [Methanoregula boonei 6A8]